MLYLILSAQFYSPICSYTKLFISTKNSVDKNNNMPVKEGARTYYNVNRHTKHASSSRSVIGDFLGIGPDRRFKLATSRSPISQDEAALQVVNQNRKSRHIPDDEKDAISRLKDTIKTAFNTDWGPDLAIKVFRDLDRVFFCGQLWGNVCVRWAGEGEIKGAYGETTSSTSGPSNSCVIKLDTANIFRQYNHNEGNRADPALSQMFATLLHEVRIQIPSLHSPFHDNGR